MAEDRGYPFEIDPPNELVFNGKCYYHKNYLALN